MKPREQPYIWPSWITPLLAGENSCEWKVWMKAHYQDLPALAAEEVNRIYPNSKPFDSVKWNENHTALLTKLQAEYNANSEAVMKEAAWKIKGRVATLAGKIDLLVINPNIVIDAKSGKPKDSHAVQVRIYLLAIQMNAMPGIKGDFKGLLRYANGGGTVEVPGPDETFKDRLFTLIKRIGAADEPKPSPSFSECSFCDLAKCPVRVTKESMVETNEF